VSFFIRGEVGALPRQGLRGLAWRTSHRTGGGRAHRSLSLFDRSIRFERMPPYQPVIIFTSELMNVFVTAFLIAAGAANNLHCCVNED
jgi:hypothetical protein